MTDRLDGFFVVLEKDIRDDDAASTIEAIKHIKGVIAVQPHIGHSFEGLSERTRTVNEVTTKLYELIKDLRK